MPVATAALEALLRLRQASCHTALVPGREADGSSKIEMLMESLDNVVAEEYRNGGGTIHRASARSAASTMSQALCSPSSHPQSAWVR